MRSFKTWKRMVHQRIKKLCALMGETYGYDEGNICTAWDKNKYLVVRYEKHSYTPLFDNVQRDSGDMVKFLDEKIKECQG